MRYVFTLTHGDFVALHRLITRRLTTLAKANPKLFLVNLLVWTPLGIAFAAYAALFRKYPEISHDLSVVALAVLLGVGLMIAAGFYKQRIHHRSLLSSNSWFLKQQTVDLDSHRLRATGAYGKSSTPGLRSRHWSRTITTCICSSTTRRPLFCQRACLIHLNH
jgi:hypothetical protein